MQLITLAGDRRGMKEELSDVQTLGITSAITSLEQVVSITGNMKK